MQEPKKRKSLILWDIDGTLLLTGGAGIRAFNRTFEQLYNHSDVWRDINPDGRTDDSLVEEIFLKHFNRTPTSAELEKVATLYNQMMGEELPLSPNFRLMPAVIEVLTCLSSDERFVMGLATGNYEPAAWHKLKRAGLEHHFHFGGFGTDSHDRPTLTARALEKGIAHLGHAPEKVFLVGDTIHDIACGKKINAITIAVATGSTSLEDLRKSDPHYLLPDLTFIWDVFGIKKT